MTDVMSQIMGDQVSAPTNVELDEVAKLAEQQLDWERKIEQLETDLSAAKEAMRQISEFLLPEAMSACGLAKFTMANGLKIEVKDDVYASIRKETYPLAIEWLDKNNLGGIVKDDVSVKFGRGEAVKAKQLVDWCQRSGFNVEEKLSVHPMTFKATVKEQMANGVVFPEELFSTGPLRKTVIKLK